MTINYRNAIRSGTQVLLGLAGPTGVGKTYSALLVATGMREVTGGEVYGIDTENGRMLHYADEFQFKYADMKAPFSPARYLEHIEAAQKAGAKIVIVDSASHMHEGIGGVLDQHDSELERMAGGDFAKRERVKFAAWIKPKADFNRFVNTLLQIDVHAIFCFRAKDKLVLVKNAQGKSEPVSAGWTPIITERMDYEMTASLILPPGAKGVPDLQAPGQKIPQPLIGLFRPGEALSRKTGKALAEWARGARVEGGKERPAPPSTDPDAPAASTGDPLFDDARDKASDGSAVFKPWYATLTDLQKDALKGIGAELRQRMDAADERAKENA